MNGQTDNQQRKVSDTDIAWLAGLWDGEGSIGMRVQKYRPVANGRGAYFAPYVQLVNTHVGSLDKVDRILTALQVGHHISWPRPHINPGGRMAAENYKPMWAVKIHGLRRCKALLDQLLPFLVIKREAGELVKEFIASRESSHYTQLPYTPREWEIVNQFRLRRHSGRPTEALSLNSPNDYMQEASV